MRPYNQHAEQVELVYDSYIKWKSKTGETQNIDVAKFCV